jgi:hypothetical protein
VHREVPLAGLARDALGDGPTRQRTAELEPEVVVEAARIVALHHEDRVATGATRFTERLRRPAPGALALVLAKACHALKDASHAAAVNVGVYGGEPRVERGRALIADRGGWHAGPALEPAP